MGWCFVFQLQIFAAECSVLFLLCKIEISNFVKCDNVESTQNVSEIKTSLLILPHGDCLEINSDRSVRLL